MIVINCRSTPDELNLSFCPLSCYVINACSLKKRNALQLLNTEIQNFDVDIAAVTETWLNNSVASTDLSVTGYNIIRRDRIGRKGGGLCIFVKDCLITQSVAVPTTTDSKYHKMHELLYLKVEKASQVYFFMLVYHPPRPKYKPDFLLVRLSYDVEYLMDTYPNAIIYLTGDFNQLNISVLVSETGLQQVVNEATRGNSILDLFLINRPNEVHCSVFRSCVKTDHHALLINCADTIPSGLAPHRRCKVNFYDLRESNIDA